MKPWLRYTWCPWCGRENPLHTSATGQEHRPPREGNPSICWGCGRLAIFTESGLRLPTEEESARALEEGLQAAVNYWREHRDQPHP